MGNGPSLGDIMNNSKNLEFIKKHDTFGLNAAYRVYKKYNFYPTYFGCFDYVVNKSHKKSFEDLVLEDNDIKEFYFIGDRMKRQNLFKESVYNNNKFKKFNFIPTPVDSFSKMSNDFRAFFNAGSSGGNALQIGIMKGYKRIVLLGCDCNYVEEIEGVKKHINHVLELKKNLKHNPNYWFADYQKKGDMFNPPGTSKYQMGSWRNMASYCPSDVEIINCSEVSLIPYFKKEKFSMINIGY